MTSIAGKKVLFCGNRSYVLDQILDSALSLVNILPIKGSYLERHVIEKGLPHSSITTKQELIQIINTTDFDIFISNGCPFILPISNINKNNERLFINIHPSVLPDLRGMDPVPGAILFNRDSGATCHLMEDTIDTGDIISQVRIKNNDDLDAALLYQMSFMAEQDVFTAALKSDFSPAKKQNIEKEHIYYSIHPDDKIIKFSESIKIISRRIRAFNTRNQGAYFIYNKKPYKVSNIRPLDNHYLKENLHAYRNNEIVLTYENRFLLFRDNLFFEFSLYDYDILIPQPGTILE